MIWNLYVFIYTLCHHIIYLSSNIKKFDPIFLVILILFDLYKKLRTIIQFATLPLYEVL